MLESLRAPGSGDSEPTSAGRSVGVDVEIEDGSAENDDEEGERICAICLEACADGTSGRLVLPCKHVFHETCLENWLHAHAACPVCRAQVTFAPDMPAPE